MLGSLQVQDRAAKPCRALALAAFIAMLPSSAPSADMPRIDELVTSKGIKAWFVEEHSVPIVAIKFAFIGGAAQDPDGKEGLADLLCALLAEGAGDLNAAAFKRELSGLGAQLSLSSGRDTIIGGFGILSKRLQPSVELFRKALIAPRFDPATIDRVRGQHINDVAHTAIEPRSVAMDRWYIDAFPGASYGRPVKGTQQSLLQITRGDIEAQHARLMARDTLKIVIVGDVEKALAAKIIDDMFGDLPGKAQLRPVARLVPQSVAVPVVIAKDQPLATAVFGMASLGEDHTDFAALEVLSHVIGSGDLDSTLMEEIRIKRGLTYSVHARLVNDSVTSLMLGGFATKNENMADALRILRDVLSNTADDGPAPAQFENAKRFLTGSFFLDFDSSSAIASSLLRIMLAGHRADYLAYRNNAIEQVTLEGVKRVARQVLHPDRLIVTIVGRPSL